LIVQCEHCQTKYRIPDEKVKGKAARVRCTKCSNTFTVLPGGGVPAAAPPEAAPPAEETARSAPEPQGPSPSEPQPEPASKPEMPPAEQKQSADSPAMQPLEEPSRESSDAPESETQAEPDLAGPELDDMLKSLSGDFEPPSLPEDIDGGRSSRPAHEIDRTGHIGAASDGAEQSEPDQFEIESTLREDQFEPLQSPVEPPEGDFPGAAPSTDEEMGWGNITLDPETDSQPADEGIGLAEGGSYQPAPPPPPFFEEEPPEVPEHEAESGPGRQSLPSYTPEKESSGKGSKVLLLILFIAALAAGGYFAYPKVMEMINPQAEQTVGTLTPDSIQVRSLSRQDGSTLYTVRGVVRNDSSGSVGMIQVEAQFRNTAGTIVAKSSVYCGNIFDDSEIISGDLGKLLTDLQNELGQSLSNQGIQPGQDVPFLIVLENPPPDVSKVTVTISGFKETT